MGAILAVIGNQPQTRLAPPLAAMMERSAYRGKSERCLVDGAAIAVQSLDGDASLARHEHWVVAFHGFIGNWDDLRRDYGLAFDTGDSPAQRIAKAYAQLGDGLFVRLRGEFALLIYDCRELMVLAVRDVVGARPLFYQVHQGRLFIASEIRQILTGSGTPRNTSDRVVASYLLHQPIPLEQTLDVSVLRVIPGSLWRWAAGRPDAMPGMTDYWAPPPVVPSRRYDTRLLAEQLRALLEQAVRRSLPEQPCAVTLSGGLDSASVWALVADRARRGDASAAGALPVSMIFPGQASDESRRIALVRQKTGADRFVEWDATERDPSDWYTEIVAKTDACLVATAHHVALWANMARAADRRVVLTGLGEEWIGGGGFRYLRDDLVRGRWWNVALALLRARPYRPRGTPRLQRLLNASGLSGLHRRLKRTSALPPLVNKPAWPPREDRYGQNPGADPWPAARKSLLRALEAAQSMRVYDSIEQLAASHGVALRYPLNDLDIINFAFTAPPPAFTGGMRDKHLLRLAVADLLPTEVGELEEKVLFWESALAPLRHCLATRDFRQWPLVQRGIVNETLIESLSQELGEVCLGGCTIDRLNIEKKRQASSLAACFLGNGVYFRA